MYLIHLLCQHILHIGVSVRSNNSEAARDGYTLLHRLSSIISGQWDATFPVQELDHDRIPAFDSFLRHVITRFLAPEDVSNAFEETEFTDNVHYRALTLDLILENISVVNKEWPLLVLLNEEVDDIVRLKQLRSYAMDSECKRHLFGPERWRTSALMVSVPTSFILRLVLYIYRIRGTRGRDHFKGCYESLNAKIENLWMAGLQDGTSHVKIHWYLKRTTQNLPDSIVDPPSDDGPSDSSWRDFSLPKRFARYRRIDGLYEIRYPRSSSAWDADAACLALQNLLSILPQHERRLRLDQRLNFGDPIHDSSDKDFCGRKRSVSSLIGMIENDLSDARSETLAYGWDMHGRVVLTILSDDEQDEDKEILPADLIIDQELNTEPVRVYPPFPFGDLKKGQPYPFLWGMQEVLK